MKKAVIFIILCAALLCGCGSEISYDIGDASSQRLQDDVAENGARRDNGIDAADEKADAADGGKPSGVSDNGGNRDFNGGSDSAAGGNFGSGGSGGNGEQSGERLFVYVCGAVANAGVYELPENSRVCDAVEAAGGFSEDADGTRINLAQRLADGQQITVLRVGETGTVGEAGAGEASKIGSGAGKVNINTASAEELMTLSGIGRARADAVIEYRTRHGAFASVEDILNISGIGEKLFEKIKDNIEV